MKQMYRVTHTHLDAVTYGCGDEDKDVIYTPLVDEFLADPNVTDTYKGEDGRVYGVTEGASKGDMVELTWEPVIIPAATSEEYVKDHHNFAPHYEFVMKCEPGRNFTDALLLAMQGVDPDTGTSEPITISGEELRASILADPWVWNVKIEDGGVVSFTQFAQDEEDKIEVVCTPIPF